MSKKYGLLLPEKEKKSLQFEATRNIFGNDSDSDEGNTKKPVLLQPSDITKRQAKISQQRAIHDDPTVYQYDEIYDEMTNKKITAKNIIKKDRKPQYIGKLLEAAQKRKSENERRIERQVQKECETEGDKFADKEIFVTSAYRKKLEEMRIEEEKEKREEYLESIGDVTKQKDLGGFYRHLYEQKLGANKKEEMKNSIDIESPKTPEHGQKTKMKNNDTAPDMSTSRRIRNYRKRKSSVEITRELSEGEIVSDEEINRFNLEDIKAAKKSRNELEANIDADSDFSIDESSDEDPVNESSKDTKQTLAPSQAIEKSQNIEKSKQEDTKNQKDVSTKENIVPEEATEKIDIWKKRTVGVAFEQALKRYYERKAARGH